MRSPRTRPQPTSSSSTPARSSTRPRKNRSTRSSRWRSSSARGSCKRLVVTGCLAERYRDQLQAEIPEIDVVLGTGEVPEIIARARGHNSQRRRPMTLFRSRDDADWRGSERRRSTNDRSNLSLRRQYAAPADDAAPLRLREGRRGLRLHVRVLHHPDAARRVPQPRRRLDRRGGRTPWPRAACESCC